MTIVAQVMGFFAFLFFIFSVQKKSIKELLFFQTIANFLYALQYIFLQAFSAGFMNLISIARCILFTLFKKENHASFWTLFVILGSILVVGIFSFDGFLSLIPLVITAIYAISTFTDHLKITRICFILCGAIWIFYNIQVGAYSAILGNVFEILSGVIALIRYKR